MPGLLRHEADLVYLSFSYSIPAFLCYSYKTTHTDGSALSYIWFAVHYDIQFFFFFSSKTAIRLHRLNTKTIYKEKKSILFTNI